MTGALPAIAKVLIRHFLYDHKSPELMVCHLSMGHGSEIGATLASEISSLPGVLDIEHHKNLSMVSVR